MSIDEMTARKVARLARIAVTDDDIKTRTKDLNGILKWIEQLSSIDTDGVEPLTSVADMTQPVRKDVVNDGNDAAKVLANAPEETQGFYVVPKVVEQET